MRVRMGDSHATEDVVAEAFLNAARSFGKFDPTRAKFSTWVIKIAINCMHDHWRRSHPATTLEELPEGFLSQPDTLEELTDHDLAYRLLSILPPLERTIVVMKYREGYRNVDIAAELGMNASTVSTKLANSLARMRASIAYDQ